MAASVEELSLIDAEDNKEYKIIVSREDAEKARKGKSAICNLDIVINFHTVISFIDMTFATLLLKEAKKSVMQPICNTFENINERKYHKRFTLT